MQILPKVNFNLRSDQILSLAKTAINAAIQVLNSVGNITCENASFGSVIQPLASLELNLPVQLSVITFLYHVSPHNLVYEAS